jgi:hypothetical protein
MSSVREESDMAAVHPPGEADPELDRPSGINPIIAAALFGGTVAAAAGAYFGTRALARRNRAESGRPLNSVMATAITACDLAHGEGAKPPVSAKPAVPAEPVA